MYVLGVGVQVPLETRKWYGITGPEVKRSLKLEPDSRAVHTVHHWTMFLVHIISLSLQLNKMPLGICATFHFLSWADRCLGWFHILAMIKKK